MKLTFWLFVAIVISGAILFMVMVGMVKITPKSQSDLWIEVNSQILNGIFTLLALSTHPLRIYYLFLYFHNFPELQKVNIEIIESNFWQILAYTLGIFWISSQSTFDYFDIKFKLYCAISYYNCYVGLWSNY